MLESSYHMKPVEITPMIRAILATPGLQVINGELISRALDHYENMNVDIVDGHIAALMKKLNITDVFSFDRKHLSRIGNLNRIEP
jgi:predicted nucleic-acid-binding protein